MKTYFIIGAAVALVAVISGAFFTGQRYGTAAADARHAAASLKAQAVAARRLHGILEAAEVEKQALRYNLRRSSAAADAALSIVRECAMTDDERNAIEAIK